MMGNMSFCLERGEAGEAGETGSDTESTTDDETDTDSAGETEDEAPDTDTTTAPATMENLCVGTTVKHATNGTWQRYLRCRELGSQ